MIQYAAITLILLIVFGVFIYYKVFKADSKTMYDIKVSDNVYNLRVVDEQAYQREQMRMLIPTYLSYDIYKDITNKQQRIDQIIIDYFYLLDLANKTYHSTTAPIVKDSLLQDEKYLPIIVFAKYIVDNEQYISDVPAEKMKAEFQQRFSMVSDMTTVMQFLNEVSQTYRNNKSSFDNVIFEKYVQVISDKNTCPSCITLPEQESPTMGETFNQPVTQPETIATQVAIAPTMSLLEQFVDVYSKTIAALVQHKVEFYNLYQTKQTDADFIKNANFGFVLRYAKFIYDNQTQIDQLDQTEVMKHMMLAAPNYMTDPIYSINGMHVQSFIILASNLYQTNRSEVNLALSNLSQ